MIQTWKEYWDEQNRRKAMTEEKKSWTDDKCPICTGKPVNACKCPRNERWCGNGHHWRRTKRGTPIMCGDNHTDIGMVNPDECAHAGVGDFEYDGSKYCYDCKTLWQDGVKVGE